MYNFYKYKVVCYLSILLFCFLTSSIFSQSIAETDSIYIFKLIGQSKDTSDINPNAGIVLAQKAINLSIQKKYLLGIVNGYNALGSSYKDKSDYRNSLIAYNKATDFAKKENLEKELSMILYNISGTYEFIGMFDKSFETCTAALQLKRKLGDSIGEARCYRQIAQCLYAKGDTKLSIKYFQKAIEIQRKINKPKNLAITLCNMSVAYIEIKNYKSALVKLYEANAIALKTNDNTIRGTISLNLGYCYAGLNKNDSANFFYKDALSQSYLTSDFKNSIIVLNNLGDLNYQMGDFRLAERYLQEALLLAKKENVLFDLEDIYKNLAKVNFANGNYKSAYLYNEQSTVISDSVTNEQKIKIIEEMAIRFETKEVEAQNKILLNENTLQKTRAQQKNYLIITIALFSFLSLIIFILFIRQNKYKTQKESLDIEQKLLQIQMNPHFIFNSLQAIQSFILTNKHKESSSYLTSFSRLMRLILENSKHDFITLDKEIGTLTYYLKLQQLRFKDSFNYIINVQSSIDTDFIIVPPMLLQPFIENAIEHGFKNLDYVGVLNFNIYEKQNDLILEIIDNGHGIEQTIKTKKHVTTEHTSYAIEIIKKRIQLLNQKLKLQIKLVIQDLASVDENKRGSKISILIPNFKTLKL